MELCNPEAGESTFLSEPRARSGTDFLTADWVNLAMVNYEVDPSVLKGRLPAGTEIDTWDGKVFVSLVGFLFRRTKVLGMAIPFHREFQEVNLRFYVRHKDPTDGWKRGVVFVKEIVPRMAIALVARKVYGEPYVCLPMRHTFSDEGGTNGSLERVCYEWRFQGEWNRIKMNVSNRPFEAEPGSQEEFITEHYWGYSRARDGRSREYRVEHPRWKVWEASDCEVKCNTGELYGKEFAEFLSGDPSSAFLAEGSPVIVHKARTI